MREKSFKEKHETFMNVCENFQPVFRYFCMEKFLDPAIWFEKRLAYTRSVATSSIGNILKTFWWIQHFVHSELQGNVDGDGTCHSNHLHH